MSIEQKELCETVFSRLPTVSTRNPQPATCVRNIVHLGISDFYTAIEELRHPELKRRPLALAEAGDRSVIQGVNGNARKEGIREGMPLSRARRLCRRIFVMPSDLYYYREKHREIVWEFGSFSPLVEGGFPGPVGTMKM